MSRPSPSAADDIPRLLEKLSSGNVRDAMEASRTLAVLATASDRDARRLAQGGALPALVQALRSPHDTVAAHAGAALCGVASVAPDLVADAASGALVVVLCGEDTCAAMAAAALCNTIAERNPARVAAEPGALQALCSALCSRAMRVTIDNASAALCRCAMGSPRLARLVADTPGLLPAMVGEIASSSATDAAHRAVLTLFEVARAGADLAARVVSTPGAVPALSRVLLQCSDVDVAERAAGVFAEAAKAGPRHANAIATPDVLTALVSAASQAGMGVACMGAFANIAHASLPLATRVAAAPGAEAAMLAALTGGDLKAAINAICALEAISLADGKRVAQLLSARAVPPVLAGLLQSDEPAGVRACTKLLAHLEQSGAQMVARLPPLPGRVLQALCTFMKGDDGAALCAALVQCRLVRAGGEQARRVIDTPGFVLAISSALRHRDTAVAVQALALLYHVDTVDPPLAADVARGADVFPVLLRAFCSSGIELAVNAGNVLSRVCAYDPGLARRAAEAPGVLPALVEVLQRGAADLRASQAVCALESMAVGVDGLRQELAARLAAEQGLIPALAAFAQSSSGMNIAAAAHALAAMACAGGDDLANLVGSTEGAIPALVRAISREVGDATIVPVLIAAKALEAIMAASPERLGRRVLDAGAAAAAVAVIAASLDGLAPQQGADVADSPPAAALASAASLLRMLATLDAAAVAAAIAPLLPLSGTAASAFARAFLDDAPLCLGPAAISALARQAEAAAQLRARAAALEALTAAAAAEADAARPRLCAACGVQQDAAGAVRLRPCAGCCGKGPAGRVLYCGADCQRAHWPAHKAYCKRAAAAPAAEEAALGGAA